MNKTVYKAVAGWWGGKAKESSEGVEEPVKDSRGSGVFPRHRSLRHSRRACGGEFDACVGKEDEAKEKVFRGRMNSFHKKGKF